MPEYTRARLYDIAELLGRINTPAEKDKVEAIRDTLSTPAVNVVATATPSADEAVQTRITEAEDEQDSPQRSSSKDLTPWREVIRPNNDVALGTFEAAEFAADLQQVHDGRADATGYGNPVKLLQPNLYHPRHPKTIGQYLSGVWVATVGTPVIQTKTGFGGGKTHSLIALYHLVKSSDALINPPPNSEEHQRTSEEINDIMREAEWAPAAGVQPRVAVLDGTYLAPTDETVTKETGDPLNTLWGVMAYQLGGQDGYEIVGEAAREGTAPGRWST